jgi:hypothetical protein
VEGREGYSSHHRGGPPLGDQMVATSILEQRYWAMSWEKLGDAGSRPYRGSGKSEARCSHSRSSGRCSRADDRRPVPDSTDVAQAAWKRTKGDEQRRRGESTGSGKNSTKTNGKRPGEFYMAAQTPLRHVRPGPKRRRSEQLPTSDTGRTRSAREGSESVKEARTRPRPTEGRRRRTMAD